MRRPRMTTRRWMVAVAAVAALLAAFEAGRRWERAARVAVGYTFFPAPGPSLKPYVIHERSVFRRRAVDRPVETR